MAQSIWYRILSASMLLAIVLPVFPPEALSRVEAAEVGSATVAPEAAVVPDFTVPRPAEGQNRSQAAGPVLLATAIQGDTNVAKSLGQGENELLALPPASPLREGEEITLTDLPTPFIYVADSSDDDGGAWRSLDLGETWMHFTAGLAVPSNAFLVEVSRSDPAIVYLGIDQVITDSHVLYKSTDYGETWVGLNGIPLTHTSPTDHVRCSGLIVNHMDPDIVTVLATSDSGEGVIYHTANGGTTWITATSWFQSELGYNDDHFNCLAQDARNPRYLLAALHETLGPDPSSPYDYHYLRSVDAGESFTWTDAPSQTPDYAVPIHDFAMDGGIDLLGNEDPHGEDYGVAVYESDNYGYTWTESLTTTDDFREYHSVAIDPFNRDIYYAMNQYPRIYRSMDAGIGWTVVCEVPAEDGWWGMWEQIVPSFSAEGLLGIIDHGDGIVRLSPDRGETFITRTYEVDGYARSLAFGENLLSAAMCNGGTCDCEHNPACCAARYQVGRPIDTFSGNHSYQVQDLGVPIVGGALSFERTYASQNVTAAVLGYGWTHSYNMRLTPPAIPNGMVTVTSPDGSELLFFANGDGTYTPYPGVQGALVRGATTYTLTGSAQTTYAFDQNGSLTNIYDPQGRAITLTYKTPESSPPQLDRVTAPGGGRYLQFGYDGQHRLASVSDQSDRQVSFVYTTTGDLAIVTDTRGFAWTYSYTGSHLLYDVEDPNGNLVERTVYDEEGRAIRQWSGDAGSPALDLEIAYLDGGARVITDGRSVSQTVYYDARNTWTGLQDAAGESITRTYDAHFNLNYVEDANGNPTEIAWGDCGCRPQVITDALGYETRMLYDAHNNLISTTDALSNTTLYDYDLDTNLLLSTTDALEHVTYYSYSNGVNRPNIPAGLLIWTQDPLQHETRYQYDEYGQVLSVATYSGTTWITLTTYAYDSLGRQISVTDVLDRVDVTYYDGGGYVTRTVENCTAGGYEDCRTAQYNSAYPDRNIVSAYAYDGVGNRLRVTNTLGIVTAYGYDDANRLITVTENYEDGHYDDAYPDEDISTVYGYDEAGNQVTATDPESMVTRTFYDNLNRPITVTANYIDWGQYDPQFPDRNVSTFYGYDAAGNQVTVTNPLGMVTLTGYDALNRPVVITQNYTTTTPNPDPATYNLVTRYSYDAGGNQTRVTDPRGVATCYEYDELNRVSAVVENCVDLHGLPGPLNVTTEYEYDAGGNRVSVLNPLNVLTRYEYDDLTRLARVVENAVEPAGQGPDRNITTRYRYDLRGNRTQVIDPLDMVTRYQYDELNRLITTTANYTGSGQFNPMYPDRNVVTVQRHDGLGRRTAVVNPLGIETRYYYDDLGRTVEVKENVVDLPAEQDDENVRTIMVYDQRGNRTALIDPEGYTTTYAYDDLSRLLMVTDALDQATVYGYDAAGNRTQMTDANENTTVYGYDELGRVIAVTNALTYTTHYAYDAAGNRVRVTDAAGVKTCYEYDALTRLVTVTENCVTPGGPQNESTNVTTAYGYDLLGNLTTITNARDYVTTYAYDALSRLVTETDALDHSWAYVYDALSRRTVLTDASGITTTYEHDALSRLCDVTYGGTITATYAHNALGQRVAMTDTTGVTRYGFDDLGRVTGLTHTVGQQVDYTLGYRYDARSLRTGLVYPDNSVISYTYDAAARLTAVLEGTTPYAAYQYDPAGRLTLATWGDSISATYDYDDANHLTGITHRAGADLRARYTYAYDQVGNRTQAVETVLAGGSGGQASVPGAEYLALWAPSAVGERVGGVFAPLPQPQPPIVRERGSYRAVFDADGLRFSPRHALYSGAEHQVAYRLTVVRRGNDVVLQPNNEDPVLEGENLVQYWRGDTFVEEYDLTASGAEQRFRFLAPVAGEGDLVIEGNLTGNLQKALDANTGAIIFHIPGTAEVVATYSRAIVADAAGRRLQATLELNGAHLRIVVPGDWLSQAVYPVVVDPLIGTNVAISTQPIPDDQERAAVAAAGPRAYLVAWQGDGSGDDIYAQVVSATGALVSATLALDTRTSNQSDPDVAGNTADHEYLVVWQHDAGMLASDWDISGRLVYSDGTAGGAAIAVYTGSNNQQHPAVAYNGNDGQYMVVWDSSNRGVYGLYGQVVEADGTLSGTAVTLYTATTELGYPEVTFNVSDTQYLVVWQQHTGPGINPNWDVWGQVVSAGGNAVTEAFTITTAGWDQVRPAAASNVSDTQYLVVWQSYVDGSSLNDIQGQRVGRRGERAAASLEIATGGADQQAPEVTWGEELAEYLVTWEQTGGLGGANWDVGARRVARLGTTMGAAFAVYSGDQDQRYPAAAYSAAAVEYLVAWQDYRSGSAWDVYTQRVGVGGDLRETEVLVSAEHEPDAQQHAAVAYGSGAGQHLVVWQDSRGLEGMDDIYGQFVGGGGALVGISCTIAAGGDYDETTPAVAYNADDDEYLVVWAEYQIWMAKRYIAGRRVAGDGTLLGERLELGSGSGTRTTPAVSYNETTGYFLVTWEDTRNGTYDVSARGVPGGSGSLASEFAVRSGTGDQRYPDVAGNATTGSYLVVWQDGTGSAADIYAQEATVSATTGARITVTAAASAQEYPAVAYNGAEEEYLVVWQHDTGRPANGYDIHGRVVEGAAGLGAELLLATGAADQRYPAVAWEEVWGYAAVWQEGTSGADIHGAILDEVGVALAGAEPLAAAGNAQERPALSYDTDRGRFLAVWTDYRDGGSGPDIYGQLFRGYTVVVNYDYDGLYRLVEAAYSDGAYYGYAYDAVGNRTRYTNTTAPVTITAYTYDTADRLTAVTRAGVQTTYTWSDRGELLADGTQNYAWDAAGRLIGVTGPGDLAVSYDYDGANNRVGMTVDGTVTAYVVDPYSPVDSVAQVLQETTGNDTTRNLYGLDLFAQQAGETTTYLGYDALSVRLHLDDDGAIAATYRYGPYGEVVGAGPAGYGYTGEQWDHYIKMTFLRARYYQPETGRFISRDPWPGEVGRPMTMQRGLYVGDNPVNFTDPSGLQSTPDNLVAKTQPGGAYALGLIFARSAWWNIYEPRGLSFYIGESPNERCFDFNADYDYSGSDWHTVDYLQGFTTLPHRVGANSVLAKIGTALAPPQPFTNWYLGGPPVRRADYGTMWISKQGYAYLNEPGAMVYGEYDLPGSLDNRPAVEYFPYNSGRNVNIEGQGAAAEEARVTFGTGRFSALRLNSAAVAASAGVINVGGRLLGAGTAADVYDREYQVLLQEGRKPPYKRAIIQTFHVYMDSDGRYQIAPHYLHILSDGYWGETPMVYNPRPTYERVPCWGSSTCLARPIMWACSVSSVKQLMQQYPMLTTRH